MYAKLDDMIRYYTSDNAPLPVPASRKETYRERLAVENPVYIPKPYASVEEFVETRNKNRNARKNSLEFYRNSWRNLKGFPLRIQWKSIRNLWVIH